MADSAALIRMAQILSPQPRVRVGASCRRDAAVASMEDILDDPGATPDQVVRERARARSKLSSV